MATTRFTNIWLIDASTSERIEAGLGTIGRCLSRQERNDDCGLEAEQPASFAKLWLGNNKNWLLILDNLGDQDNNSLLPSIYEGTILITTQKHTVPSEIAVGNLSEENSIKLFLQTAHEENATVEERQLVWEAVRLLGHLPIAVSAAGCLIRWYATMPLLAKTRKFIEDFRNGTHRGFDGVWRVFNLSISAILDSLPMKELGISREDVLDTLYFLSNLDSGNLSSDVLSCIYHNLQENMDDLSDWTKAHLFDVFTRSRARTWNDHRIHRLLSHLALYNLIALNLEPNNESKFKCSMHFLVQRYLLRIQESPVDVGSTAPSTWNKAAVTLAQSISWKANADGRDYDQRRLVVPHIIALLDVGKRSKAEMTFFDEFAENSILDRVDISRKFALAFYESSYIREARELRNKTVQALRSTGHGTPELHLLYSKARRELATCEGELGNTEKAIELVTEVLEDHSRAGMSNEDDEVLMSKANLASYYHVAVERCKELPLRKEVLEGYKITKPKDDETVLDSMRMLASTLYSLGRRPEARRLRQEVYEIRATLTSRSRIKMLQLESDYAESLSDEGWWLQSLEIRKRVLDEWKRSYGHRRHDILLAMTRLATGHSQAGMKAEARDLRNQTLDRHRQYYGEEHHGTLEAMEHLASSEAELGNLEEALALQNRVVKIQNEKYGENHRQVLSAKDKLGSLLFRHGSQQEQRQGLRLKREVLSTRRSQLGRGHQETLMAMDRLAICLEKLRKFEDSARLRRKLIVLRSSNIKAGEDKVHPETLRAIMALADNYDRIHDKGRERRGETKRRKYFHSSLDMQRPFNQCDWWDSQTVEDLVDKISRHDLNVGHEDLAIVASHIRRSVQRHVEGTFGLEHRVTLDLKIQISGCEACAKRTMKAIEILREVEPVLEQQRGKYDAELVRVKRLLGEHLKYVGIKDEEHENAPLAGFRLWRHRIALAGVSFLRCIIFLCCCGQHDMEV
jgi:tetratricopeptide (TPR) repeat protein